MTCEVLETKYIDTSFQVANGQKYNSQQKKILSENLWLNTGEKQKNTILLKGCPLIFTSAKMPK